MLKSFWMFLTRWWRQPEPRPTPRYENSDLDFIMGRCISMYPWDIGVKGDMVHYLDGEICWPVAWDNRSVEEVFFLIRKEGQNV